MSLQKPKSPHKPIYYNFKKGESEIFIFDLDRVFYLRFERAVYTDVILMVQLNLASCPEELLPCSCGAHTTSACNLSRNKNKIDVEVVKCVAKGLCTPYVSIFVA